MSIIDRFYLMSRPYGTTLVPHLTIQVLQFVLEAVETLVAVGDRASQNRHSCMTSQFLLSRHFHPLSRYGKVSLFCSRFPYRLGALCA
jgi:hypothetical protein